MFQQFNISRSGFGTYQKVMFNITNNISNANTPGYKSTTAQLATLFPVVLQESMSKYAEDENMSPYIKKKRGVELGTGVRIEAITTDFSEGSLKITNNELDMAIQGRGFFQLRKPNGDIVYTRAGNFTRDVNGVIMSQSGNALDPPINIPNGSTQISIDKDGRVFSTVNDSPIPQQIGQILISRFENPDGLKNVGDNAYEETENSGQRTTDIPGRNATGQIVQKAVEGSNVDIIKEMMEMIMTQKGLELLAKAMNAGEAMLKAGMGMT